MAHLVKAFVDYLPEMQLLRDKMIFRIKDLLYEGVERNKHNIHELVYGDSDSLEVTCGVGNAKVLVVKYYFGQNEVCVKVKGLEQELNLRDLSHDDCNAIYENLYDNIVNQK